MSKDRQGLICLGAITGAQGVRGEVVIKSYTQQPEDIGSFGPLTDRDGRVSYEIKVVRSAKKGVIASVKGVNDRDAAARLRGVELYVSASLLPEPEEGEWYYSDLVGLEVRDPDGVVIGEIVSVQNFGAGDLIEIRQAGSDRTEFLPLHEDYVSEISVESGHVLIDPPDDFWD